MAFKTRNGSFLFKDGHLCTTCCEYCYGPNCVNFALLFPPVAPELAPNYSLRGYKCGGMFAGYASTTYIATLVNPLPVAANLVITSASHFDDDLEVDGVSIGGPCSLPITIPVGTILATKPVGGSTTLTVVDNYGINTGGDGCACWVAVVPGMQGSGTGVAKPRFEVCKQCPDSPDGFSCRLVSGCCFGRKRTDPSFHCPVGKW